ncbi:MAG: hypothetical protein KJO31_08270 [Gammaproteobacteria bacterium]|nr:hypothetical protein [Gammaproteobacteria bacterium]
MNKTSLVAALAALTTLAGAAIAEPGKRMEIRVLHDGEGPHEPIELRLDSSTMDFNLDELQIGETRSVVDEAGRTILITRQEDGYEFDVAGRKINLPESHGSYAHWSGNETTEIEIMGDGTHDMFTADAADGIFIVSGETLDQSTKDSIRAVLQSAGHDAEVKFFDGGGHGGTRQVKVIKKRVTRAQ